MTTSTPQDIAKAERIIHHSHTPIKDIASAIAAERSRWQAECADEIERFMTRYA